jgi:ADP-ribose pyrophosphatase YjhB (NUDIX family)
MIGLFCPPRGVAVFVINQQGFMAVSQRKACSKTFPGYWQVPGGKVFRGEVHRYAASRELAEETGLMLPYNQFKYLGYDWRFWPSFYIGHSYQVVLQDWQIKCMRHTEPEKNSPWVFMPIRRAANLNLIPGLKKYLSRLCL